MVGSVTELRECYPDPLERSLRKSLSMLDAHMRRFIGFSPFLCLGEGPDPLEAVGR